MMAREDAQTYPDHLDFEIFIEELKVSEVLNEFRSLEMDNIVVDDDHIEWWMEGISVGATYNNDEDLPLPTTRELYDLLRNHEMWLVIKYDGIRLHGEWDAVMQYIEDYKITHHQQEQYDRMLTKG